LDPNAENWGFKVLDFTPKLNGWRIMGDVEFDGLKKYDEDCDEHCPVEFP